MANRHTLHVSKLESFKKWLVKDGWEIEEPKGIYEVLRARKFGRNDPLIVYRKADAEEHLTIMNKDSSVVGAFLRDCKNIKTNSDRIRSMSDAELAEFLVTVETYGYYDESVSGSLDMLEWLHSEVEE